jgi:hypothetical protein
MTLYVGDRAGAEQDVLRSGALQDAPGFMLRYVTLRYFTSCHALVPYTLTAPYLQRMFSLHRTFRYVTRSVCSPIFTYYCPSVHHHRIAMVDVCSFEADAGYNVF